MNIRLLKNLDFASKINQTEAISEAGKEMLNNYRGYVYSNPVTCGVVNGFVVEAQNFSFDTGLVSILADVQNFIDENKISWKLASACESISRNNSNYNYIAQLGVEKVGQLLEMNESDVISYIKAGALKGIQYIPEFRAICKEVYGAQVSETRTQEYTISYPVSYVFVNENQEQYFTVLGKTYKNAEGKISEAVCDDTKFARINMLLESFQKDDENIFYEYKGIHGDVARFTISESGLTFTKGEIKESFTDAPAFAQYCNTVSKAMQMNEKMNWMKVTSAIAEVFEAFDSVVVMDCASLLNTSNGTVCAIIEGKDNVNLTVFRSMNAGTSCKNFDYMNEALTNVVKLTGIDLKSRYTERINEDCKKAEPEEYKQIKEQLAADKESQMNARKKKIAMLAEQFKNDPVKITLLNKAAKDLAMLED